MPREHMENQNQFSSEPICLGFQHITERLKDCVSNLFTHLFKKNCWNNTQFVGPKVWAGANTLKGQLCQPLSITHLWGFWKPKGELKYDSTIYLPQSEANCLTLFHMRTLLPGKRLGQKKGTKTRNKLNLWHKYDSGWKCLHNAAWLLILVCYLKCNKLDAHLGVVYKNMQNYSCSQELSHNSI